MRVVIAGGAGHLGTILAKDFAARGDEVIALVRSAVSVPWRTELWDGKSLGAWASVIDGSDVIVNLAGRSVDCRYTEQNRREIMDSRVDSTRVLGEAIAAAAKPPAVWLQSSTATIYSHRFDAANDEKTGIIGGNEPDAPARWTFSIEVARAWEAACEQAATPHTRKVLMRTAMVMDPFAGGIFQTLLTLVKRGLGGSAAGGKQFVSWLHYADFVSAVHWLIDRHELTGAVNLAAPNPLPYNDFMRDLRAAAHVPIALPATRWMLEIGAFFMRTETELVLKSRRVIPMRLLESGFSFAYPRWAEAAKSLVAETH